MDTYVHVPVYMYVCMYVHIPIQGFPQNGKLTSQKIKEIILWPKSFNPYQRTMLEIV